MIIFKKELEKFINAIDNNVNSKDRIKIELLEKYMIIFSRVNSNNYYNRIVKAISEFKINKDDLMFLRIILLEIKGLIKAKEMIYNRSSNMLFVTFKSKQQICSEIKNLKVEKINKGCLKKYELNMDDLYKIINIVNSAYKKLNNIYKKELKNNKDAKEQEIEKNCINVFSSSNLFIYYMRSFSCIYYLDYIQIIHKLALAIYKSGETIEYVEDFVIEQFSLLAKVAFEYYSDNSKVEIIKSCKRVKERIDSNLIVDITFEEAKVDWEKHNKKYLQDDEAIKFNKLIGLMYVETKSDIKCIIKDLEKYTIK